MCIYFLPTSIYACGTKTEKSCCKKEKTTTTEKKDCCKNTSPKENDNDCGGKCGHLNCTSSSSNTSFNLISVFEINIKNNFFDFSSKKSKFYHPETNIAAGYFSLWLPPFIS